MMRTYGISRLADDLDPTLVLCGAVIQRAVHDACSKPNSMPGLTREIVAEARAWLQSEDLMPWVEMITPINRDPADIAAAIRSKAGIGHRPEQSLLPMGV